MHKLFAEIENFRQWALIRNSPYENEAWLNGDGEWECDYYEWGEIYRLFNDFISNTPFSQWNYKTIEDLLYIIARDNENEILADEVSQNEELLFFLAEQSLLNKMTEPESKWLLAIQLKECKDKQKAEKLLLLFVQDEDEYVSRRSLLTLADIKSSETEKYCKIAWDKIVDGETHEYQRIAVLHSLFLIKSDLLPQYIEKAKEDGRKYLLKNALELRNELKGYRKK